METISDRKRELARILGETEDNIKVDNPRWVNLLKEGVIVDLDIGRWRGKTNLSWKDLGLQIDDNQLRSVIKLGHKILLPKEFMKKLDSLESKARANLDRYSFKTFWGNFVPVTGYQQWKEVNEELREEYLSLAREIRDKYDQEVSKLLQTYRLNAALAYRHFENLYPDQLTGIEDKADFTDRFINSVKFHIKTKEEFFNSIKFETNLSIIPLPSMLKDDILLAQQREAEYYENKIELEKREELARIEIDKAKTEADIKLDMIRDMNRDLIGQMQREKEQKIDQFLTLMSTNLRSLTYNACNDVLGSIKKSDKLGPRSIVQLKKLVDQLRALNLYGDSDIEQIISSLQNDLLEKSAKDRDIKQIENLLSNIAGQVKISLIKLDNEFERTTRDNFDLASISRDIELGRNGRDIDNTAIVETEITRQSRKL